MSDTDSFSETTATKGHFMDNLRKQLKATSWIICARTNAGPTCAHTIIAHSVKSFPLLFNAPGQ